MARSSVYALAAAFLCLIVGAVTWFLACEIGSTARLDANALQGFLELGSGRWGDLSEPFKHLVDLGPFMFWSTCLVGVAVMRRRLDVALAVIAILVMANATTQLLKPGLDFANKSGLLTVDQVLNISSASGSFVGNGSWPSGHTTAAMSLALCAVLVSPNRFRPYVAAAGGVFVLAVVFSILLGGWHYPSDILGGFLVATFWTLLGVAALSERRRSVQENRVGSWRPTVLKALRPCIWTTAAVGVAIAAIALFRVSGSFLDALDSGSFVSFMAVITATGLLLPGAISAFLRR